jgi:perosamine synthetase
MIRLAKPFFSSEETSIVSQVLASGMLVQGAQIRRFEELVAAYCQREYAVAVSSGTAALYLALQALGIKPGDHVLCPDLTWPSPANAIAQNGADLILVDVDFEEWNASPSSFLSARTNQTKAIIAIDQFGNPARSREILDALPDIPLIVDAACSLGSEVDGSPAPSFGVIACLSFHPRKVLTTGEGGMCLTDDRYLSQELRELRNHGLTIDGVFARHSGNYRLSEIAAGIGVVQMSRLEEILFSRRRLADRYHSSLSGLGLRFQRSIDQALPNYQTFGVLLPPGYDFEKRDRFIQEMRLQGVECGRLSYAVHLLPSMKQFRIVENASSSLTRPVSEEVVARGIALPLHPALTLSEQDRVIETFGKMLQSL